MVLWAEGTVGRRKLTKGTVCLCVCLFWWAQKHYLRADSLGGTDRERERAGERGQEKEGGGAFASN